LRGSWCACRFASSHHLRPGGQSQQIRQSGRSRRSYFLHGHARAQRPIGSPLPLVQINLYDGPKGPYQDTIDKLNNAEGERHFAGRPVILNLEFSAVFRLVPEAGELPFSKGEQGRLHLTRVWKYSWLSHLPPRR